MKRAKILLAAGAMLAAGIAYSDEPTVASSSELTGQALDTRVIEGARTISSVDEIWPFTLADEGTIVVTADGYPQTAETLTDRGDGTAVWTPLARATYTAVHSSGLTAQFDLETTEGLPPNIFGYTVKCVPESFTYDGTVKEPSVTVSLGDDVLTPGEDYTVVIEKGSHVGAYRAVVTGINGRGGILHGTYTVQPQPSTLDGQKLDTRTDPVREADRFDDILPFVYIDGTTITVTRTNDASTVEFIGAIDSTTNWIPSNFGFFAATNGSLSAAFRVNQLACDFAFNEGGEYDWSKGAVVEPVFTLKDRDYVLKAGEDYTFEYSDNDKPGTATLTITGIGKYTAMGTIVKTFKIRPGSVSDSTLTDRELDTRETGESRILNGVDELLDFAYNNVPGWPKDGNTETDAATVRLTPMIGVAGGVANWFPAATPYALESLVPGEATVDWTPSDGFTCYKAEMLLDDEVAETAYLNLNGAEFENRATVTVAGGETMTPVVTTNESQTLTGELTYRWYVYNPTNTWYEGLASTEATFTPGQAHYEKAMRILVFDENGYAGMSETLWCSKLPVVYITTENGQAVVSKDIDVAATMRLQGNARFTNAKQLYDGEMTIHTRGNQTANAEKKPYKIKLDSKANLLGLSVDSDGEASKNKHWVLLSNPYDFSLLRNKTAYDLSGAMGLTHMASEWVDVVMNGEYVGNYQLCEHIRVGEDRVDIFDWEGAADDVADAIAATNGFSKAATKDLEAYLEQDLRWVTSGEFTWTNGETYVLGDYGIDTNQFDISGGYLFELDMWEDEVSMFYTGTSDKRINLLTKVNRPEYLNSNPEMLEVAKTLWNEYWAACVAPDGYYQGVHYTQMSSLDSMVSYWLVQMLMGQRDNNRSRYAYKPVEGLLQWGPAWDFDHSCGGPANWTFNESGAIVDRFDSRSGWEPGIYGTGADAFYQEWVDDPYFVLKAFEKLNEMKDYLDDLVKVGGLFDENVDYIFESGVANADLWAGRITQGLVISPFMRFDGENGDVAWFRENLTSRINWIRNEMRSIRAAVASLKWAKSKNPYTDSADKFAFDFVTPHVLRPVEGEGEGATPDIMLSNASNLETRVTLTGLTAPATVDVYVNGLSNGTYAVESSAVAFTVNSNEFTNVDGHRNMISLVAKNASGAKLATTYSLVTTIDEANYPQQISNATVTVDIAAEVQATGMPYEPTVTITVGEGADAVTLVAGEDYKVEYLNNVNPGTATVRITGLGNPYGTGEFPRGNWMGTVEKTFTITAGSVAHDELTDLALDTRTDLVRKPDSLDDILPFAWNDDSAWPTNGTGAGNAVVSVVPVAGEGADPAAWTNAGPVRTFVDAAGEDTNAWTRQYAKLYRASLVNDAGATTTLAYFDLTALDLPPDPVDLLRSAFGGTVEITVDANGDPTVTMTEDLTGPVSVPSEVGAFTLDVNGKTLSGTNGVDGTTSTPGTDGGPAIVVVGAGVEIAVTNTSGTAGGIVGGKGGNGNPPGNGAAAISGTVTVTDPQGLVTSGENGQPLEKTPEQKALEEAFEPNAYVEPMTDDDGNITNYVVVVTNDITGPVMIPDNLGKVKIDLNGHTITGPNGETGSATEAGTSGQSAIVVYHDTEKSGEPTELALVDGKPDTSADIIGGNGGDGNAPGNGAPAIKVNGDVQTGVTLEVGEDVDIQGGKGGNALGVDADGNGVPGGQGGAGVEGDVQTNDGTITGGAGGNGSNGGDVGGNGGNGGAGVTGTEGEDGTGTTTGGNGGQGGDGDKTGGNGGNGGAGNGNDPATGTGGNGGQGGDGGETGGEGGQGGAGDPAGQSGDDGKDLRGEDIREVFPEPTYEVTGPDADGVYTVTLQEDVIGPVMIPDNLGKVKIDLNGHTIMGPDGTTGSATEAGTSGQSAIVVYHDTEKSGEPTELALVDGDPDTSADIIGGNGGDGNPPGNGAPAIKVNGDVQDGVTLDVGENVDVVGGKGGNALGVDADGNGVPGGQGGAGVDGNVKANDGTITGGAGGNGSDGGDVGGNGGNGGAGVTGTEGEDGTGTTTGGNGGNGGDGDTTGGNGGQGGAGNGNEPATGTGGNGGNGGDGGETGGTGGQGGAGDPAGQDGDDGKILGGGDRFVTEGSIVIVGIDPAEDGKWAVSFTLTLKEGAPQFATWLDNTANAGKIKLAVAATAAGLGEATSVGVSNVRVTGENTATVDCTLAERDLNLFKVVIEE